MTNNPPPTTSYLLQFWPVHDYFFGGEQTFGSGPTRNYLVRSEFWPQQTTVLGALRYLLLQRQGWLAAPGSTVPKVAAQLIGETSFQLGSLTSTELDQSQDFGLIYSLSPVFLMKEGVAYYQADRAHGRTCEPLTAGEQIWYGGALSRKPMTVSGYDPKQGFVDGLINSETGEIIPSSKVFLQREQIGIEKGERGLTKDQALYKQTYRQLAPGWRFACYLHVRDDVKVEEAEQALWPTDEAQSRLPIGGERQAFHLLSQPKAVPTPFPWKNAPGTHQPERLVLLSDALLPHDSLTRCAFAITGTRSFQFLRTRTETTASYSHLADSPDPARRVKSGKYRLITRGSVLYPLAGESAALQKELSYPRLHQIGYNHFLHLPSNLSA